MTDEKELARPEPPIVGKVTHHSVELSWTATETETQDGNRMMYCVQEEEVNKTRGYGTVYNGYSQSCVCQGLDPNTQYHYRMRSMNQYEASDWSPAVTVFTTRRPLTSEDLHKAVLAWDLEDVKRVLESKNVAVDVPDRLSLSALMIACQKGYRTVAEMLIDYGADVNYQSGSGKTSLMVACYAGHLSVIHLLHEKGVQWTQKDKGGSSAIHYAVDGGQDNVIGYIVQNKLADVNERDASQWSPLLRAAAVNGHVGVADVLLTYGADIEAKDMYGRTSLMLASLNGHSEFVKVLLDHGANKTVENQYGANAVQFAESFQRTGVLEILEPGRLSSEA
ncbi:fibronectin type 3 and ankyrin repeat domains protein 1-like [Corticium candelabrum]|uniref:fibronectin type 3 and ankyrin repeat domains protein 1-like n=1 Tax=Corticium candelabrum TaxID=121492 RepID=UPI002E26D5B6|nr:fibronectin type 3 and ankyrin repeat domains protein 1-like [Corticium candelabrum]